MKIKNEYIIIQNGKKQIKLHNLILDRYIEKIVQNQFRQGTLQNPKRDTKLKYIYIKFDDELIFDKTSFLSINNFDLVVEANYFNVETNKKNIINNYVYKIEKGYNAYEVATEQNINNFSDYNGRKITTLGFGTGSIGFADACIDISTYNIYFDTEQVFTITRKDKFTTDGFLYSNNRNIKAPIHLISDLKEDELDSFGVTAILRAVGFGVTTNKIDEEYSLLPYNEHIETGMDYISILDEFTIEYTNEGLFPATGLFPAMDLYPARIIQEPMYPNENIYPSIELYPAYVPYQFMQLKYILYKNVTELGYYIVSIPINGKKKIKMNINYERA